MRTIIQHIGPLYGEANTGSVFGQPNGSIAVGQGYSPAPPIPEPEQIWRAGYYYDSTYGNCNQLFANWDYAGAYSLLCFARGKGDFVNSAFSITLTGTIATIDCIVKSQVATDDQFENIIAEGTGIAGQYSGAVPVPKSKSKLEAGKTYYARAVLYDSAGNYLNKFSNTLTFTGQTGYT